MDGDVPGTGRGLRHMQESSEVGAAVRRSRARAGVEKDAPGGAKGVCTWAPVLHLQPFLRWSWDDGSEVEKCDNLPTELRKEKK